MHFQITSYNVNKMSKNQRANINVSSMVKSHPVWFSSKHVIGLLDMFTGLTQFRAFWLCLYIFRCLFPWYETGGNLYSVGLHKSDSRSIDCLHHRLFFKVLSLKSSPIITFTPYYSYSNQGFSPWWRSFSWTPSDHMLLRAKWFSLHVPHNNTDCFYHAL